MGAPKLLFGGRRLSASKIISASSQGAIRTTQPIAGRANVGSLTLAASGIPAAMLSHKAEIVGEGALGAATFKVSLDGGTTWIGRRPHDVWDGNGATERIILTSPTVGNVPVASRIVALDTNGDGVADAAFVAMVSLYLGTYYLTVSKSTDLVAGTGWAHVGAITTGQFDSVALIGSNRVLTAMFQITSGGNKLIYTSRSADYGVTWSTPALLMTVPGGTRLDACLLASSKIALVFTQTVAGFEHVYISTSADGVSFSAAKAVTSGSASYSSPSVAQNASGKTIVFFQRTTATAKIEARENSYADPAYAGSSFAAYSETLWATDSGQSMPSVAIGADGAVYVAMANSTSSKLQFSHLRGSGTFAAVATIDDPAAVVARPRLSNIGGALWLASTRDSDYVVRLLMAKYSGYTYGAAGTEFYASATPQLIGDNTWYTFGGGYGKVGDYWTLVSEYVTQAGDMLRYVRGRPARSTNDTDDWSVVLDAGANNVFAIDTVALRGNYGAARFQMNATDVWSAPSVDEELSFVRATYAATTGYTLPGGGRIKFTGGGLTRGALRGARVQFATSGNSYLLDGNDADEAYVHGVDVDGEAGVMSLLAPAAWKSFAVKRYRFIRLLVEAQDTPEGAFETAALVAGIALPLSEATSPMISYRAGVSKKSFASGVASRARLGGALRVFSLVMGGELLATKDALVALLDLHDYGVAPFALIPDSGDPYDFAVVAPTDPAFDPSAVYQFTLPLDELL